MSVIRFVREEPFQITHIIALHLLFVRARSTFWKRSRTRSPTGAKEHEERQRGERETATDIWFGWHAEMTTSGSEPFTPSCAFPYGSRTCNYEHGVAFRHVQIAHSWQMKSCESGGGGGSCCACLPRLPSESVVTLPVLPLRPRTL